MASQLESLVLDILLRDRASDGLGRISRASESAAGSTDTLNRKLEELGKKTAEARVRLAGDKEAQASLDKIDVKLLSLDRRTASPNLKVEGAARAIAEMSAVSLELDKLGGKGGAAEKATASLGSSGLSGMSGMGALIGAGVALSPVIFTLGLGLSGVALAAAGAALPIEKAAKASGGLAANMHKLNPEQQAVAKSILGLGQSYDQFQKAVQPEVLAIFGTGLQIARNLLRDIQPLTIATGKAFNIFLGRVDAEFQSGTWQQFFGWMAATAAPDMQLLGNVLISVAQDIPPLMQELQPLAVALLQVTDATAKATGALVKLDPVMGKKAASSGGFLSQVVHDLGFAMSYMAPAADTAAKATAAVGIAAKYAGPHVYSLSQQVAGLTAKENAAISPMLAYTNSLLTQASDGGKLRAALKASHDAIGLHTHAQEASFSAAQTYIQDLLNTASAAVASHQGIDKQISSLSRALPLLEGVKGQTKEYREEIRLLVAWLAKLAQQKSITEEITVMGKGGWHMQGGGSKLPAGGASGMYITAGTGPMADDVLVRASRGELIVPANLVNAGAVSHLHGMIPGFAGGGIIGSYAGALKGLQPWGEHNMAATIQAITAGIAGALSKQLTSGGAPGGNAAVNAALARAMFPQYASGMNWAAWNYVAMRESGWNRFARNPSSGAYGIPQALPESKLPFAGQSAGGSNAGPQIAWMAQYMRSVYGGPVGAAVHESAFNWYGRGLDAVISSPTLIGVGERGPERVTVTPAGGGAQTIIIYVDPAVAAATPDRQLGRHIANQLGAHIKGGGRIYPAGMTPR